MKTSKISNIFMNTFCQACNFILFRLNVILKKYISDLVIKCY